MNKERWQVVTNQGIMCYMMLKDELSIVGRQKKQMTNSLGHKEDAMLKKVFEKS